MTGVEYRFPPDPRFPLSRREVLALLETLAASLGLEDREVALTVVGDRDMAALNRTHLGCTGPTNVLAFESGEDAFLGEIVLSAETLARETALYGQEPRQHLARLLAHALLHLAGLDHGPEMEALTEQAVLAAGPGD